MSGHGFHAHGPHDHELEHQAQAEPHGMAGHLAVATAIIATVGALFAYMGGLKQVNASLYKNEAAIKKTDAANQWAYYQAKNNRQNIAEIAVDLVADARKDYYRTEAARYKGEKAEIQKKAEDLEKESTDWDQKSEHEIHEHHRWQQATTALQVAIAMAAIALLTRSRRMQVGVYVLTVVGVVIGVLAWMHI
jgi:lipopolysaccharide export LptBFGC system permease protein LptF